MPELPEVETVVRDLRASGLMGRTFLDVAIHWPATIQDATPASFRRHIRNVCVTGITRRGKFVVIRLSTGWHLLIHFRMTGRLLFAAADAPHDRHEHVVFKLDDGRTLRFHDTRKFGRMRVTDHPDACLGRLGPEPLSATFPPRRFVDLMSRRKGMLKPLLLNQHVLAGLGNIYVDEALFDCGLHPQRQAATVSREEWRRLYRSIRKVLRRGIRTAGTTLGKGQVNFYSVAGRAGRNQDHLKVFRRQGQPCPRCGTTITRLTVGQRGTHVCESCQPWRAT